MHFEYSEHAEQKFKERRISKSEVEEVLKSPEDVFLDIETGNLVAVGKRSSKEGHRLIIIYSAKGGNTSSGIGDKIFANNKELTKKPFFQKVLKPLPKKDYAIKTLCELKSEIVYEQLPQDDPMQRKPDISKAKEILGWEPKVGLEEGLKRTIKFFKDDLVTKDFK
jgi:hypothetical protein